VEGTLETIASFLLIGDTEPGSRRKPFNLMVDKAVGVYERQEAKDGRSGQGC
jgi:hypothetical protein